MAQTGPDQRSTGTSPAPEVEPSIEPPQLSPAAEDLVQTEESVSLVPPEITAQTLREYVHGRLLRIRGGDAGMLPVLLGLIAIVVVFQSISPHHVYLKPGNIVNLFQQSAVFMVLAMAETFVLLLGDIDLAAAFTGVTGGAIAVQLVQPVTTNWPWWAAVAIALLACAFVGLVIGLFVTLLRLPSFIVTLAFLLIMNGVLLIILGFGPFSGYPSLIGRSSNLHAIYDFMWGHVTPTEGWISMAIVVGGMSLSLLLRDSRRRRSGLVAPPLSLSLIKIVFFAGVGITVVAVCNVNRAAIGKLQGVPWAFYIVLGVLGAWTFLLGRTRWGRYIYAMGGNVEASRRAGVNVIWVRTTAFVLCSMTAGIAGLLYASYQGGMSNNVNTSLVLYAVGAAVIGGTSLFGGRGKAAHGVLGGLVIGAIYNGMYLLGLAVQWEFIVTGGVVLYAVTIDALSRRGSVTTGSHP